MTLLEAWRNADPEMKALSTILMFLAFVGWIWAIVESTPKRKEAAKFLNTTGWKIGGNR